MFKNKWKTHDNVYFFMEMEKHKDSMKTNTPHPAELLDYIPL